jgi:galactose mutarotase-like enzyme
VLPDHGEVWTLPWDVMAGDNWLALAVQGRALPYQLTRTMSLPDAATLRLDYTVVNNGGAPFAALWAAHPQFVATPATAIRLPDVVESVLAVQPIADWAPIGTPLDWPVTRTPDAARLQLDRVTTADAHTSRKVYTHPDQAVGWAMLTETDCGHWLRMAWDPAQIPYLGIWVDEGQYNPALTVALEPSTGFYDSLVWAVDNARIPVLKPGERLDWSLTVAIGQQEPDHR